MGASFRQVNNGFTIIEMMIVILIIGVLLTIGIPSFQGYMERNRLKSAAEGLVTDLHFARSEAILRGPSGAVNVVFLTDGSTRWCYGMTTEAACDCRIADATNANACVLEIAGSDTLKRVVSTEYQGDVSMASVSFAGSTAGFTARRGLTNAGVVQFTADGNTINVGMTALGVIRVCSPSSIGYPACS